MASAFHAFGWSHGKEIFDGQPDNAKGSYYANPQYDTPYTDQELIDKWPTFCHPNIWPEEDMPELSVAFKACGQLIVQVGKLVAHQVDKYVKIKSAHGATLESIIEGSMTCKARLLHYFPLKEVPVEEKLEYSSWCGWHNDHGSLTGLCPAMYLNEKGEEVPNPDPQAGLYIKSRKGDLIKAVLPSNYIAFQIGESAAIKSGGILHATPHCVRGAQGEKAVGISRETLAVFMEPMFMEPMGIIPGSSKEKILEGTENNLPPGVPSLSSRWEPTQTFGEFNNKTMEAFSTTKTM